MFLAGNNNERVTVLKLNIISNLFQFNIELFPRQWVELVQVIQESADHPCPRTRLLRLSFLIHISKIQAVVLSFYRTRLLVHATAVTPVNRLKAFCAAALANPQVQPLIGDQPDHAQLPGVLQFRIGGVGWDFRGFVCDGNFVAIRESIFEGLEIGSDPRLQLWALNLYFHESMHAITMQRQNDMNNMHTPNQPGLINPKNTVPGKPLEAGWAGEIALWGIVPEWGGVIHDDGKNLAAAIIKKSEENPVLELSVQEKEQIRDIIGVDKEQVGISGMVVAKLRVWM